MKTARMPTFPSTKDELVIFTTEMTWACDVNGAFESERVLQIQPRSLGVLVAISISYDFEFPQLRGSLRRNGISA